MTFWAFNLITNNATVRLNLMNDKDFTYYSKSTTKSLDFIIFMSVLIELLICSIRVNFTCLLKLWTNCLKCMDAGIAFGLLPLASFLWLFSRMLKGVSTFLRTIFYRRCIPSNKSQNCFYSFIYFIQFLY